MYNDAKEKMENKFSYLNEYTTEQLENLNYELEQDLEALWKSYNSLDSEKQSDIWNDIKYDNEQQEFINKILEERKKHKAR